MFAVAAVDGVSIAWYNAVREYNKAVSDAEVGIRQRLRGSTGKTQVRERHHA